MFVTASPCNKFVYAVQSASEIQVSDLYKTAAAEFLLGPLDNRVFYFGIISVKRREPEFSAVEVAVTTNQKWIDILSPVMRSLGNGGIFLVGTLISGKTRRRDRVSNTLEFI